MSNREEIEIRKVILQNANPRYTYDEEISYDFLKEKQKVIKNLKEDQAEAITKLLTDEGSGEKLLNLVMQMKDGFNENVDVLPYLIRKNKDSFVVVEGNRRFLVLKLLSGDEETINIFKNFVHKKRKGQIEKDFDLMNKKFEKNKQAILNEIEVVKNNFKSKIPCNVFDIDETNKEEITKTLTSLILSRHSYTESLTRKEWSRSKSLFELSNRFKRALINNSENLRELHSSDYKETLKDLSLIYQRDENKLHEDIFVSLYFVRLIKEYSVSNDESLTDVLERIPASVIELSRSNVKSLRGRVTLRNYVGLKRKKINKDEEVIFHEKVTNENIEEFIDEIQYLDNSNNINWKKIANFLIKSIDKGFLTTRGFFHCKGNVSSTEAVKLISDFFNENLNDNLKIPCFLTEDPRKKEFLKTYEILNDDKFLNNNDLTTEEQFEKMAESEEEKINNLSENIAEFKKKFIDNYNEFKEQIDPLVFPLLELINYWENEKINSLIINQDDYIVEGDSSYEAEIKLSLINVWNFFVNVNLKYAISEISDFDPIHGPFINLSSKIRSLIEMMIVFSSFFEFEWYVNNEGQTDNFPLRWFYGQKINKKFKHNFKNKEDFSAIFDFTLYANSKVSLWNKNIVNKQIINRNKGMKQIIEFWKNYGQSLNNLIHKSWIYPNKKSNLVKNFNQISNSDFGKECETLLKGIKENIIIWLKS